MSAGLHQVADTAAIRTVVCGAGQETARGARVSALLELPMGIDGGDPRKEEAGFEHIGGSSLLFGVMSGHIKPSSFHFVNTCFHFRDIAWRST
jgi:hypothetical protein